MWPLNLSVMNKFRTIFLPSLLILLCVQCNKRRAISDKNLGDTIENARLYFVDSVVNNNSPVNYRASQVRAVQWDLAQIVQLGNSQGVVVPIVYFAPLLVKSNFTGEQFFHLDYLTRLLIYKDSTSSFRAEVITDFPDSNYFKNPVGKYTGMRFVEDWNGNTIEKLLFSADGSVRKYSASNKEVAFSQIIAECYTIDGYNYSPETGEIYEWSEDAGCSYSYIYDEPPGGSSSIGVGSPGGTSSWRGIFVMPGNSVIKSISSYFQCFTNVGGSDHMYSVTVCVDQPEPGTREPWVLSPGGSGGSTDAGNVVNSGHTFLVLTETYGSTTITRNVGFYPATSVWPASPSASGQLNDDENHLYNISGSFIVNDAQFFEILNFISSANASSYLYNLNTNNCTTFAINAVAQAGINLPRTVGTWPGGAGDDPGDLGEDIRGGKTPGMTINGSPNNNHSNAGQCN